MSEIRKGLLKVIPLTMLLSTILGAQDVLTFHNDVARTGVQSNETALTPGNINSNLFGKVFSLTVDGDVYAQPLYVSHYTMSDGAAHNVLFVATEHDWVYAFDADGKNPAAGYLWKVSLLGTGETWVSSGDVGTGDITPDIGIVGTPAIDKTGGTLYVVAKSKTASGTAVFNQRLHALNLANGAEKLGGPTLIQASLPGTGDGGSTVAFSPLLNNQRPGLLLAPTPGSSAATTVFIAWASHGDNGPYHGWVIGYNAANIAQQTFAWVDTPNGSLGGIWMSAGGLATDGSGNIYGGSGNGTYDGTSDFAMSLFRLTPATPNKPVADWFTPVNQASLSGGDQDFGTGGAPLVVPNQTGPVPHLILTADKSGQIYLLNRDNLGKFNSNANPDVQDFNDGGYSVHSNLVFFNNSLYLAPDGGPLEQWAFNPATGKFTTPATATSTNMFGCNGCDGGGSNFSISANGTQNGIVWAIDYSAFGSGPAVLHAYNASNVSGELYNSSQATGSRDQAAIAVKFCAPTIANGHVYVGGRSAVTVYGLLNTSLPPASAPAFSPAGGTYTSAQAVTLSDATSGAKIYYTTDGSTPTTASTLYSTPLTINANTTINAIATAAGYSTSPVSTATYAISTSGGGTVALGSGFAGAQLLLNGSAKINGSRLRLTDGGATEAASAYYATPLNVQSFVTNFSFQLTNPNADGFTFVIQNAGKTALGPAGGGLGYGPDNTSAAPGIPQSVAVKFDLYNNAGEGVDSTGIYKNGASPTVPATDLTSTGLNLHSGDTFSVHAVYNGTVLSITLTDTVSKKSATQSYTVNIPGAVGGNTAYVGFTAGTGGSTATQDIISWTYAPQPYFPSGFSTNNLSLNGGAALSGSYLRLTDGGGTEARSAFFSTPQNVSSFTTDFSFVLTNPNADGFTFAIESVGATAVGPAGGGLGYGPDHAGGSGGILNSVAVKFDLYNNAGEGIDSTGLYTKGASPTTPSTDLTSSGINLHSGDLFKVHAVYNGTTLTVTITDSVTSATATQNYTVNIPGAVGGTTAYVGFTAGTGGETATQDIHTWTFSN